MIVTAAEFQPDVPASALAAGRDLCLFESTGPAPAGTGWPRALWDPVAVFCSKDQQGTVRWRDGTTERADGDPFRRLAALLQRYPDLTAAGYWAYDLRYCLEHLPRWTRDDLDLPDCRVGLYEKNSGFRVQGSETGVQGSGVQVTRSANDECRMTLETPISGDRSFDTRNSTLALSWGGVRESVSRKTYEGAVRRVLEYIAAGDCYQVNLSHRLSAPLPGSAWELYQRLRAGSPAPYAAYLDCGDHQVLSASPELFLRVRGREVETHPIKGTRPRGRTPEEDRSLADELLASAKDRAELLMIVDLERNDLGRVCDYGSVSVPELFRLESYSNVHHLVATVRGRLRAEVDPLEALRAAFPGGSITGAPKIRAMEIIEELEPFRRGVYTGAIGWVDGRGNAEWNIAIRTMVVKGDRVYFHVGGGVVADSDPGAEYLETLAKARGMLQALSSPSQPS